MAKIHDNISNKQETAVLVGLITRDQNETKMHEYLDELAFLTSTAGAKTVTTFYQKLPLPDNRTYVGKGKLEEIKLYVQSHEVDMVIFDDELTPSQQRNIEAELLCLVLDRSLLILDIFASRAKTQQARTQVELAQLQYLLPRLRGMWEHLDRQKGGIGMRGTGEKEIETDRRMANIKISALKEQLKKIEKQNLTQRKSRGELIRVALVGYTNVGKSTLMNLLSKSDVLAENKLFATLDTTVRKVVIENVAFLLSDTVGFIRKLPHHLIESFKSTLDEVRESDILIHVVDISHPQFEDQMRVVDETLRELNTAEKPVIIVFNKMDQYEKINFDDLVQDEVKRNLIEELQNTWMSKTNGNCVFISATQKQNIKEFKTKLLALVNVQYEIRYPFRQKMW